ncbi:hypothetical protein AAKU67_000751 [Oxalobacteraceae bacterium GrIS 2.11]
MSSRPANWEGFFSALKKADVPEDFLDETERQSILQNRDPFRDLDSQQQKLICMDWRISINRN